MYDSMTNIAGNVFLRNFNQRKNCLCDIRPDCHHHFDASGTSNAMFDE